MGRKGHGARLAMTNKKGDPITGRPNLFGLIEQSARIELDHEIWLHSDRVGYLVQRRNAVEAHFRGAVRSDVVRNVTLGEALGLDDQRHFLRLRTKLDDVADVHPT